MLRCNQVTRIFDLNHLFVQNLIEQIHVTYSNIKKLKLIKSRAWTGIGDVSETFVCHALSKIYLTNWDNSIKIPRCNFNNYIPTHDHGEERSRSLSLATRDPRTAWCETHGRDRAVHGSLFATITSFFPFKESHKDWARTNDRLFLVNCPTTSNKDDHNDNDNQATGTSPVERVGGRVSA